MTPTQALPILETLRDCRPSDTLAHQALAMAIGALSGWLIAVDDALIVRHLGVADASDSYPKAKAKLHQLICWEIAVATDPAVNGGLSLQPLPAVESFDEARADVIASNGNDGEHYAELTPTPFRGRVTRRDA